MKAAPQMAFAWPAQASYAPEDFIVSPSNEAAMRAVDAFADGTGAMILAGPEGSGKTHLAQRFLARSGGTPLDATMLGTVSSEALMGAKRYAVLEDIQRLRDEQALFHLLRHIETQGCTLLLTARERVAALQVTLPDLRSRLVALPEARIDAPDEALLRLFLIKGFADHQLRVDDDVIAYLLKRMERSFTAALRLVGAIERESLAARREITVPWVKTFL